MWVGDCPTGLDAMVRFWCKEYGSYPIAVVEAHWSSEGRRAGPARNARMVGVAARAARRLGIPLVCEAFPLGESKGTRHCMSVAAGAGARVEERTAHA